MTTQVRCVNLLRMSHYAYLNHGNPHTASTVGTYGFACDNEECEATDGKPYAQEEHRCDLDEAHDLAPTLRCEFCRGPLKVMEE